MIRLRQLNSTNLKNEIYDIVKNDKTNKTLIGSESIYITTLLSNYFNIPCLCIGTTYNEDDLYNNVYTTYNESSSNPKKMQRENLKKIMIKFTSLFQI